MYPPATGELLWTEATLEAAATVPVLGKAYTFGSVDRATRQATRRGAWW